MRSAHTPCQVRKLLWHDELFTFWIAQAPSWREMLHLTRTLDWNPPLLYFLARWSMKLFGAGAEQVRLPSMLAYAGCGYALYLCVQKWTGSAVWGFVGLLTLLAQDTDVLAFEARPYALTMCFITLAVYAYVSRSRSVEPASPSYPALSLLMLSGFLSLLSHMFALLPWFFLIHVELFHSFRQRRIAWSTWLALLLPLAVFPLYLPMFQDHRASVFPEAFQPSLFGIGNFYADHSFLLSYILPATIAAVLLVGPEVLGYCKLRNMRLEAVLVLLGLLAAPAVLMLYLNRTHAAFWPRYGFCFSIAFALALPLLIFSLTRGSRSVAVVLVAFLLLTARPVIHTVGALVHIHRSLRPAKPSPCEACDVARNLNPALPLVDASGLDYVEMNDREPLSTLSNLYYVYDQSLAVQVAHATIFEGMPYEHANFHFRSKVATYGVFVREHKEFFVYGDVAYPEQWLLRYWLTWRADENVLAARANSRSSLATFRRANTSVKICGKSACTATR